MKTPSEKEIAFVFMSHPCKRTDWRWKARIVFPAGSSAETRLPIAIEDGNGRPIEKAVFEFAGRRLKVKDGKASIGYADFIRGKSSVALWLYRDGVLPMPGGLTFA